MIAERHTAEAESLDCRGLSDCCVDTWTDLSGRGLLKGEDRVSCSCGTELARDEYGTWRADEP